MSEYVKYFVYSASQYKLRTEIEAKLGKKYVAGTVIVKGVEKKFTELTEKPNSIQFPDTEVIAYGDIRNMTYTEPKVI